jgi:hypothetical protein
MLVSHPELVLVSSGYVVWQVRAVLRVKKCTDTLGYPF